MTPPPSLTAHLAALQSGESSSEQLVQQYLQTIEQNDDQLHIFNQVNPAALEEARQADHRRSLGEKLPLLGIPVAVKDNISTEGMRTTCSSRILENYDSIYDATVTSRLREAGAIIIGKTSMDEFAMGSSNQTAHKQKTRNPWDPSRVPGGSSGGSAAAVAAGCAPVALGSDTGGSIRQPAAFCGVVGLKPTYGSVSRYGLVAFASSLDQIGPLTNNVEDAATMLNVIAGHDSRDSTSVSFQKPDYTSFLGQDVSSLKIGLPREYFIEGMDPTIRQQVLESVEHLKAQGATVQDISLPHTDYAVATYYIIATAEASSNLARYDGVRYTQRTSEASDLTEMYVKSRSEGFGAEVKRRIMLGTYVLSSGYYDAYYRKAQKVRTLIARDFAQAFQQVDLIITPTTPTTAFVSGTKSNNPLDMYLEDIFTLSCNLAGIPGMSIPCGKDADGLPIGLQLYAPHFEEGTMLKAAAVLEKKIAFTP
ncbi:Asp-tRNA(Asn)/Glu-tRNA(Gln) amidotransferase subunit GatA [Desulfurispira natronophila]|uniref:Glutamyl-tRNA(Gln) amidotransferase subunit A n=1 Tax=Desulfurispira natronophila TaxID=682562 RepID=A0A7W7Y315_9BACT|nr:Asp-tRNA(Asn)/Glu-tRNA(Gln) amidotransferase subunit GatA [Desulfurispira natronophila]MBB5021109.1 aspartyl-tRNA(Asn)/glutamyl-tRNA(Gln) amidotransferase subunit A [Desulfurispira natronophila]